LGRGLPKPLPRRSATEGLDLNPNIPRRFAIIFRMRIMWPEAQLLDVGLHIRCRWVGRFVQDLQGKADLRQRPNPPRYYIGPDPSKSGESPNSACSTYLLCTAKLCSMAVSVYIPSGNEPIGPF